METTLILLKPDCVAGRKVGEVIKRFEEAGFQIRGCKMFQASSELLREHYAHLADKPFFPELEAFMSENLAGNAAKLPMRALLQAFADDRGVPL